MNNKQSRINKKNKAISNKFMQYGKYIWFIWYICDNLNITGALNKLIRLIFL